MQTTTTTKTIRVYAFCADCHWELDSMNAHGVAAKHHYKTGHRVCVERTIAITYKKS